MANKIRQYRFYEVNSSRNQPSTILPSDLVSGEFVKLGGSHIPIIQLGIQALPGTRFYLNGATTDAIIIGSTGIYELDLKNATEINEIKFDAASIDIIQNNKNAGLIIDTIYVSQEEDI